MVKIPVGIPVVIAAVGTDPRFAKLVTRYLLSAAFWLVLGSLLGLLAAFKLVHPEFIGDIAWLNFGRIRPAHIMTVLFGWASLALVGLSFYVMVKCAWLPTHNPLTRLERICANVALLLWNLGVAIGLYALLGGDMQSGREYRVYPLYAMAPIFAGAGFIGVIFYRVLARRQVKTIYISAWFILASCFWLAVTVFMGYQPWWRTGIADRIVDGYYIHNAVGMWFTPLAVGLTYYALPKLLNKPIYSYALGVLGFFTHILFYTVIGTHHYVHTPIPVWMQSMSVIFSVAMIVPVWASTGNFLLTMKGERVAISHSYSLPFFVVGIVGYALASLQGTAESLPEVQEILHLTHYTVGHAHFALYAFVSFLIWGCIYGLMPRMTGREPPVLCVGLHFWLALAGIVIYVVGLCAGGHQQGNAWNHGSPFIESVRAVAPHMVWRAVGGTLMALSHVAFVVCLWRMRPGALTMAFGASGGSKVTESDGGAS